MNNSGVFIFTKNRTNLLRNALNSICGPGIRIFVVDDSSDASYRFQNKELCDTKSAIYLGQDAYFALESELQRSFKELFPAPLRPLGNPNWNLGFARNFALVYAKSLDLTQVLFCDDDIEIPSVDLISDFFELTDSYDFVGAEVTGMEDNSILDVVALDFGLTEERMLSGGFLAFRTEFITEFFLNEYNEDWVWLYLHGQSKQLRHGKVAQAITDKVPENYKRIKFQEIGEILVDALQEIYRLSDKEKQLESGDFWDRILDERRGYLNHLTSLSNSQHRHHQAIIENAKRASGEIRGNDMIEIFRQYFKDRGRFRQLYSSLGQSAP